MLEIFDTRQKQAVLAVFLLSFASIAAAYGFEYIGGYKPCALCYQQRLVYYLVVPLTGIFVGLALAGKNPGALLSAKQLLWVAVIAMLTGAGLAAYHAGVEWKLWAGPTSCTGGGGLSGGLPDFSKAKVVMCDEAQLRIFGLSFAGWNVVVSLMVVFIAIWGLKSKASKS